MAPGPGGEGGRQARGRGAGAGGGAVTEPPSSLSAPAVAKGRAGRNQRDSGREGGEGIPTASPAAALGRGRGSLPFSPPAAGGRVVRPSTE